MLKRNWLFAATLYKHGRCRWESFKSTTKIYCHVYLNSYFCTYLSFATSATIEEGKIALDDQTFVKYVRTGTGSKTLLLLPGALGTAKSDFGPQLKGTD